MYKYSKMKKYNSDIFIFEFNPNILRLDATIGKHKKLERLSQINGEPNEDEYPIAKLNGGFFNMSGKSEFIGSFVDEGLYYNAAAYYYPTLVYWKDTKKLSIEIRPDQKRHAYYQKHAYFAMGIPWTLIVDGKIDYTFTKQELIKAFVHPYQKHPRTLLGQKSNGNIIWVVADGRRSTSKGLDIIQSANLMKELGCIIAVNLDGGGSSEMIVENKIVNKPSDGRERAIGTAFMAYAKKKSSNTPTKQNIGNNIKKTVTASVLNVRSGPGTNYPVVKQLVKGATVQIISASNGWSKIVNGNSYAYVSSSYLK